MMYKKRDFQTNDARVAAIRVRRGTEQRTRGEVQCRHAGVGYVMSSARHRPSREHYVT